MIASISSYYSYSMEKAMAPHSSTLAWKIPWKEEPGRLQSMGSLSVRHDWVTSLSLSCIGEGNGNPLQCSCLENPRDGGEGSHRVRHDWSDLAAAAAALLFHPICCYCSVAQSCPILCDPMDCSMPGFPVHHQLPEFAQSVMPSNHLILCHPLLLLPSVPASGSFPMSWLFASGGLSIGASAPASVLPINIRVDFL